MAKILEDNRPVVFVNRSFPVNSQWKAMNSWSFATLRAAFGMQTLKDVFVNHRPYFGPYFNTERPLGDIVKRPKMPELYSHKNMSASRFFARLDALANGEDGDYVFYSGHVNDNIGQLAPQLAADMQPVAAIELEENAPQFNVNLWVGPKGVITHPHYDAFNNLNVQITGKKRWTLISPRDARDIYLFPFVHPSHAQAQVYFSPSRYSALSFPRAATVRAFQCDTEAGDVLFLPPMWIHHVETMEPSINLNAWSRTIIDAVQSKAFVVPPSLVDTERSVQLRYVMTRRYIEHTVRAVGEKPSSFVVKHVWVRFEELVRADVLVGAKQFSEAFCSLMILSNQIDIELRTHAEEVGSLLSSLKDGQRQLVLANYVEFVLLAVLPPKHMGAYLQSCFVEFEN